MARDAAVQNRRFPTDFNHYPPASVGGPPALV